MPVEKWAYFGRELLIEREKVQPVTENVVSSDRISTLLVLVEEDLEVAAHVGLEERVFGFG